MRKQGAFLDIALIKNVLLTSKMICTKHHSCFVWLIMFARSAPMIASSQLIRLESDVKASKYWMIKRCSTLSGCRICATLIEP